MKLALILGVDRFMSEARALTNLIGNGVATIVVARLDKDLDGERMHRNLNPRAYMKIDVSGGGGQEPEVESLRPVLADETVLKDPA